MRSLRPYGFFCLILLLLVIASSSPVRDSALTPDHVLTTKLITASNLHCNENPLFQLACQRALQYLERKLELKPDSDANFSTRYSLALERMRFANERESALVLGALNAWIKVIDPHAQLLPAQKLESNVLGDSLHFKGIGTKIQIYQGKAYVAFVAENSGAAKAGVKAGDEIVAVNGTRIDRLSPEEKEQALKAGKAPYRLSLHRSGKNVEIFVNENPVDLANVAYELLTAGNDRVGRVKVRSFMKDSTCDRVRDALISLAKLNVNKIQLDLRDNPGGLVREARCVAGLIAGAGKIFARLEKKESLLDFEFLIPSVPVDGAKEDLIVMITSEDSVVSVPVEVQVNQNTASAAEMLAAFLRDEKGAPVQGARTHGKGTMQSLFYPWNLQDVYLYKTTYDILRPSGESLGRGGIRPDVTTDRAEGANFPREDELTRQL